ncbi:EscF/YscF/HrpA family type III secretion system needle major subunit [Pandoraea iniqua]|nr:EscF/YscF/HrpA family type III secretion system needle major subunit [Pandoraea iniqua]
MMAASAPVDSMTYSFVNSTVFNTVKSTESDLKTIISGLGDNPTTSDLLMVQQDVQKWTLIVQVQSTITKEMADSYKGIIAKAA